MDPKVKIEIETHLNREGIFRGYILRPKTPIQCETLYFGLFYKDGRGYKESRVNWRPVGDKIHLQIETSSENWVLYWFFSELFDELSHPQNSAVSEMQFCEVLRKHGFKYLGGPEELQPNASSEAKIGGAVERV